MALSYQNRRKKERNVVSTIRITTMSGYKKIKINQNEEERRRKMLRYFRITFCLLQKGTRNMAMFYIRWQNPIFVMVAGYSRNVPGTLFDHDVLVIDCSPWIRPWLIVKRCSSGSNSNQICILCIFIEFMSANSPITSEQREGHCRSI